MESAHSTEWLFLTQLFIFLFMFLLFVQFGKCYLYKEFWKKKGRWGCLLKKNDSYYVIVFFLYRCSYGGCGMHRQTLSPPATPLIEPMSVVTARKRCDYKMFPVYLVTQKLSVRALFISLRLCHPRIDDCTISPAGVWWTCEAKERGRWGGICCGLPEEVI